MQVSVWGPSRTAAERLASELGQRGQSAQVVSDPTAALGRCVVLDHTTTVEEVFDLLDLSDDLSIACARGLWRSSGESAEPSSPYRSRSPRLGLDAALPGPCVVPVGAARLSCPFRSRSLQDWLMASRLWRRAGFQLLGGRIRPAELGNGHLLQHEVETHLADLARVRTPWSIVNRHVLPMAERSAAELQMPPGRHLAVVGAQRSGTTFITVCLGRLGGGAHLGEEATVDVLLDGFPTPHQEPTITAWQATFLTPCRSLLAELQGAARLVAVIREPASIVASMLNDWSGLDDVSTLVSRLSGQPRPATPLEQAVQIIEVAWTRIAEALDGDRDPLVVSYEDVVSRPARTLAQMSHRLSMPLLERPMIRNSNSPPLDHDAQAHVTGRLGYLHDHLVDVSRSW